MIIKNNKEKATKFSFRICDNKGFHMSFKNGWTVSVQFGWGNYCDNYNNDVTEIRNYGKFPYASNTAEIWAWDKEGKFYPNEPIGYQTSEQVLKFINKIARRKK